MVKFVLFSESRNPGVALGAIGPTPNNSASFWYDISVFHAFCLGKSFSTYCVPCGTPQVLKLFSANPSMKVDSYTRYFDRVMPNAHHAFDY